MDIKIVKTSEPKIMPPEDKLGFGQYFTDHMFVMDYEAGRGWYDARIIPFGPIALHPASTVLHYGAEIFEGLKAYRTESGEVQLFRPMENIRRMNNSAERMCLPQIDEDTALEILTKFVDFERDWVPHSFGTSLYLRPYTFGNDETLGVHTVKRATFMIIASHDTTEDNGDCYGTVLVYSGDFASEIAGNQENGFADGSGPFLIRKYDISTASTIKATVKTLKIDTKKYAPFLDRKNHCTTSTFGVSITAKDAITRCKCNFQIQDNCHIFVMPTYAAYIPKKLIIS